LCYSGLYYILLTFELCSCWEFSDQEEALKE